VLYFDGAPLTLTNTPAFCDMEHGDLIDVVYKAGSVATRAAMVPSHAHVHALPSALPPPALPPPSVAQLMITVPYVNKRMTHQQSMVGAKKAQKQVANAASIGSGTKTKSSTKICQKGLHIIPYYAIPN
jgi:hypothetical protein